MVKLLHMGALEFTTIQPVPINGIDCRLYGESNEPQQTDTTNQHRPLISDFHLNSVQLNSQDVSLSRQILCTEMLWPMACSYAFWGLWSIGL